MKKVRFNAEIADSRLKTFLQNEIIGKLPPQQKVKFKNILRCGKQMIFDEHGRQPEIQLMKDENGKQAKFWGLVSCHNSFLCPTCAAHQMSKHASNIAAGIDALKKQDQAAIMITFTIMHYKNLKCVDLYNILYDAWKNFHTTGKTRRKVFANFIKEFNCQHSVRVCEFTYNDKKGWNPHFHCLFWVPKKRLQEVADWEDKLRESWHVALANSWAKHYTEKYQKEHPEKTKEELIERNHKYLDKFIAYSKLKAKQKGKAELERIKHSGLWISKKKDGKIIQCHSSQYINGWGYDKELTGKPRKEASGENSYTIHQLLTSAASGNEKHKQAITEFALAIKHKLHRRVMYGRKLSKIISAWKKTNEYIQTLLKKNIHVPSWKSLISLSKKQWQKILELEQKEKLYIRHNILFLAANYNAEKAFQLIYDYLLFYGIDIKENQNNYNFWCEIAEKLFENSIPKYNAA